MTDAETLQGALNRIKNAQNSIKDIDYYVGIEGGIEEKNNEMEVFAWVVIQTKDKKLGKGKTGTFFLPPQIVELIKEGKELGEAGDIVFDQTNLNQKKGTVGVLTANIIDRTKYYTDTVILALIPFKNEKLYF